MGILLVVMLTWSVGQASAGDDRIVYACTAVGGGYSDLCVIDPDSSSGPVNLTNTSGGGENYPVYSPDASEIAYSLDLPSVHRDLLVTPAIPSGSAINVSDSPDCQEWSPKASWSPDGASLVYASKLCSPAPQDRVYTVPANGTADPVRFGNTAQVQHAPAWSPDGSRIAFQGAGVGSAGVYMGPADGSTAPSLVPNTVAGFDPEFSPDGSKILTVISPSSTYTLRVVNADGSGTPVDLVTMPTNIFGERYEWSPDGTKIAWIKQDGTVRINSATNPADGIDLPAGDAIVGLNLDFSPDGSRVVFDAYDSNDVEFRILYTQKTDGSEPPQPVTDSSVNSQEPDWMPRTSGPTGPTTPTGPTGPSGPTGPVKTPKTVIFANIKLYPTAKGGRMLIAGVDCKAQGSLGTNPYCQLYGEAQYGSGRTSGGRSFAAAGVSAKKRKKVTFAKGSTRIPVGKRKNFSLKITKAGKKLLKHGRNLKLKVTIRMTRPGQKATVKSRMVTLRVK